MPAKKSKKVEPDFDATLRSVKETAEFSRNKKGSYDIDDLKRKTVSYPKHWETVFNEQIKKKKYAGTFQSFIADAIRDKLEEYSDDI